MRVLGLDIETAPNTVYVWGLWKQDVHLDQIIDTGRVMCVAWQWYDEPGSEVEFIAEWSEGNPTPTRHKRMIEQLHRLLTEADVVVHFNGERFDMPMLNREFIKYGLAPPAPYQQVDLLKVAKKEFRFASNKLDHLLQELGIGEKVRHSGFTMWVNCMNGDPEAWAEMETYNRGDVSKMRTLYERLRPWITGHPNAVVYSDDPDTPACPRCASEDLQKRGFQYTKSQKYQRYQCQSCGGWCRERYTAIPRNASLTPTV